jgi:hypothetical protein
MPARFTRRKFALAMSTVLSALGITGSIGLAKSAEAQVADAIQKLDYEGKPASGKQMITSLIVHNQLILHLRPGRQRCRIRPT